MIHHRCKSCTKSAWRTAKGEDVTIQVADGMVKINDATVTTPDIMASNGIIHVIDTVLLPPSLAASPADQ